MNPNEILAARTRALELAIQGASNGAPADGLIERAGQFADFLIDGRQNTAEKTEA